MTTSTTPIDPAAVEAIATRLYNFSDHSMLPTQAGADTPQFIRYAATALRALLAEVARLRSEVTAFSTALSDCHRVAGRGGSHSTPKETASCVIDAICTARQDATEADAEIATIRASLAAAEKTIAILLEGKANGSG
jgi:hypothetical protein